MLVYSTKVLSAAAAAVPRWLVPILSPLLVGRLVGYHATIQPLRDGINIWPQKGGQAAAGIQTYQRTYQCILCYM